MKPKRIVIYNDVIIIDYAFFTNVYKIIGYYNWKKNDAVLSKPSFKNLSSVRVEQLNQESKGKITAMEWEIFKGELFDQLPTDIRYE